MQREDEKNIDAVSAVIQAVANLTREHGTSLGPDNPILRDATLILGEEVVQTIMSTVTTNAQLRGKDAAQDTK